MGKIQVACKLVKEFAIKNMPSILTGLGIAGMATTVVLACKETPKAAELIEAKKHEKELIAKAEKDIVALLNETDDPVDVKLTPWESFCEGAKVYWPMAIMFTTSAMCIIFANKVNLKRNAALIAAYQLSENKFKDYQEEVMKNLSKPKEEKMKVNIAEKKMEANPPDMAKIVLDSDKDVLCYDSISGRYFKSNTSDILRVEALLNRRMINETCITLNDMYEEFRNIGIDLEDISIGDDLGWHMDSLSDTIIFDLTNAKVTSDGIPCIYLEYNARPMWLGWGE